jgi:hypothetical protein
MKLVGMGLLNRAGTKKQRVNSKTKNLKINAKKLSVHALCPINSSKFAIIIGQNVSRLSSEKPSKTCFRAQNMPTLLLTSQAGASSSRRTF